MKFVAIIIALLLALGFVASLVWGAIKWTCIIAVLGFVVWKLKGMLLQPKQ